MKTPNILVIDDDPAILRLLHEVLAAKAGYNVIVAEGGAQAARLFREGRIDVVLAEVRTPDSPDREVVDGLQLARFRPQILAMAADATEENLAKARRLGARSLILKPFDDLSILEAEIEKAVQTAASIDAKQPETVDTQAPRIEPSERQGAQAKAVKARSVPPRPARVEPVRPAAAEGHAPSAPVQQARSRIPAELENILRTATTLDAASLRLQVPIVCLQTVEEQEAIEVLRTLAKELSREFYVWSAARGLVGASGASLGEIYNNSVRALEFIRHQQQQALFVLVDFRPYLEDALIVRTLREMVLEGQTARLTVVLTAPLFLIPPELESACARFDWPATDRIDLSVLINEIRSSLEQLGNRPRSLGSSEHKDLLDKLRGLPVARARFEIARHLMR